MSTLDAFGQSAQRYLGGAASAVGTRSALGREAKEYKPEDFTSYGAFRSSMELMEQVGGGVHPKLVAERQSLLHARDVQRDNQRKAADEFKVGKLSPYRLIPGYTESMDRMRKKTLGKWAPADEQQYQTGIQTRQKYMEGLGGTGSDASDVAGHIIKGALGVGQTFLGGIAPGLNKKAYLESQSPEEVRVQHQMGDYGRRGVEMSGEIAPYIAGVPAASRALGPAMQAAKLGKFGQVALPMAATQATLSTAQGRTGEDILSDSAIAAGLANVAQLARPLISRSTQAIGRIGPKVKGKPLFGYVDKTAMGKPMTEKNVGEFVTKLAKDINAAYKPGVLDAARFPLESVAEGVIASTLVNFPQIMAGNISGQEVKKDAIIGGVLDLALSAAFKGSPFQATIKEQYYKKLADDPNYLQALVSSAQNKQSVPIPDKAEASTVGVSSKPAEAPKAATEVQAQELAARKPVDQPAEAMPPAAQAEQLPRQGDRRLEDAGPPDGTIDRRVRRERRKTVLKGRRAQVKEAEARGYTDALTNVANRASFDRDQETIENDPDLAFLSNDATSLGVMNDYGSPDVGDFTLQEAAKRMSGVLKDLGYKEVGVTETPGKGEFKIYRPGGDEFFAGGDKKAIEEAGKIFGDPTNPKTFLQGMKSPKIGRAESRVIGGVGATKAEADAGLNKIKKEYKAAAKEAGYFIQKKTDKFDANKLIKDAQPYLKKGGAEAQGQLREAYTKFMRARAGGDADALKSAQTGLRDTLFNIKRKGGFVEKPEAPAQVFRAEGEFTSSAKEAPPAKPKTPSDRLKSQRGGAINVLDAVMPNKEEVAAIKERVAQTWEGTKQVIARGVNEFVGAPIYNGARAVLPRSAVGLMDSAVKNNRLLDAMTRRPDQQMVFPDSKTSAQMFYMMGIKGWKDAGIFARFEDPVNVFGEAVSNIWEESYVRANQRQMRTYRELLYKPDGPFARLMTHYGLVNKRVRVKGGRFKSAKGRKGDEAGYAESMRRVFDALDYGAVLDRHGKAYIDEKGITHPRDLAPHEKPLYEAARKVYDDFRNQFAHHYDTDTKTWWGLEDYVNHIMRFEQNKGNISHTAKGGSKQDIPRKKFFGNTKERTWAEIDYVRNIETALVEYIPNAINKLNFERTMNKIEPVIHGVYQTTRRASTIWSDLKSGVLKTEGTTFTMSEGSRVQIRVMEDGKLGKYQNVTIKSFDENSMTVRMPDDSLRKIDRNQVDWSDAPARGRAKYAADRNKVSLRYRRQWTNPKTKQVYGLEPIFLSKDNKKRAKMMRTFLRDLTNPYDAGKIETLANQMAAYHHHMFLGVLNPKSAALNFSQSLITIAETGAANTAKATMLITGGKGSNRQVKLANGKTVSAKQARRVIEDVLLEDDYYAASRDFADDQAVELASLDPNAPMGKMEIAAKLSMTLFQFSEMAMRQQATVAGYLKAVERGATHDQAIAFARETVAKTQGIYRPHRTPQAFRRRGKEAHDGTRLKQGSALNPIKSVFFLFKRFGVMQTAWALGAGKEAFRYGQVSAAKGRLAALKGAPPVVPPASPAFEDLSEKAKKAHREAYEKLSPEDKAKVRAVDRYMAETQRLTSQDNYEPTKIFKFAAMVAVLMQLGEKALKVDWGGTMVALPFDVGRIIKGTNQNSYRGFVDSVTPPALQQAIKTVETMSLVMTSHATGQGLSNPQVQDALYDLAQTYMVPNSLKVPMDASLGLYEKIDKDDPAYDPDKPIGKYKASKIGSNPGQRPRGVSVADVVRRLIVPGRPLEQKAVEEAFQEARKDKKQIEFVQETQRRISENIFYLKRKGQDDKAREEIKKLQSLSEATSTPFSERQFKNAIKRRKLSGFAAKIMVGSSRERWRKLEIAIDKSKDGASVITPTQARYIFGELTKSKNAFRGMSKEAAVEKIRKYREFLRKTG